MYKMRYNLSFIPFYLISKIQGRNFRIATNLAEIKLAMQLTDKGMGLEDLFSTPAWRPILSLESVNSPIWETLKTNFFIFKNELPNKEKLAEISNEEAKFLISQKIVVDSKQISKSTVKIFLKWIFCENEKNLSSTSENGKQMNEDNKYSFDFIEKYITEQTLEKLYQGSLEYRKEIAVKGEGNFQVKKQAVDLILNIIKLSKFKKKVLCQELAMK